MVIDVEKVRLPERNLNLAHRVVLGDGVLVNNLRRIITHDLREDLNITWRTTVLVATSLEDTGKVNVSLNMGL